MLGLVLSGGGARGAFEAGVVAAMEDLGLAPRILAGTSAGAINAAGLAVGMDAAQLTTLWDRTDTKDVYRVRRDWWRRVRPWRLAGRGSTAHRLLSVFDGDYLMDTSPLRRTLTDALGGTSLAVADGMSLSVSAVAVATGELTRFTNVAPPPERASPRWSVGPVTVDHLLASSAIPLLFRPGRVGEIDWWDGGLVANTPLAPALAHGADRVVVVTTSTLERPAPPPRHPGEAIELLVDTVMRSSLEADLARARAVNLACRMGEAEPGAHPAEFCVIGPEGLELGGDGLRFERGAASGMAELGRERARPLLEEWLAAHGTGT